MGGVRWGLPGDAAQVGFQGSRVFMRVFAVDCYGFVSDSPRSTPRDLPDTTKMASAAHTANLPLVLWREISSYLPNRDIKSMRLASKQFPVELRLGRVFLSPNPLNIKVFRAIADHDVFRHGVTEIIWDDAHLPRGPRIWTDYPGGESDVSGEETEESFLAKHRAGQDQAPSWGSEWNFRDSDSDSEPESDDEDADLRFEHDDDDLHLVPKSDNQEPRLPFVVQRGMCLQCGSSLSAPGKR